MIASTVEEIQTEMNQLHAKISELRLRQMHLRIRELPDDTRLAVSCDQQGWSWYFTKRDLQEIFSEETPR